MRLIDADKLKKAIEKELPQMSNWGETFIPLLIDNAPTVEQRPHGKWNYIQAGMCVCPFCGASPHKQYKNFCPNCGADMREGGAE